MPVGERLDVTIHVDPLTIHSWSVLCGLSLLAAEKTIRLRIADLGCIDEHYTLMLQVKNGRGKSPTRVAIAVGDAGRDSLSPRESAADFVFRRSSLEGDGSIPLGLLFGVESGKEPISGYLLAALTASIRRRSFSPFWRTLRAVSPTARFPRVEEYEAGAESRNKGRIFFEPRAWDPSLGSDPADRERINEYRAELLRSLREQFGARFADGFVADSFALANYGELVTKASSDRSAYLSRMRACDIGIASIGLHRSTPFKIPEYLAAGRAILSEPLHYQVGPDPGLAIQSFDSVSECIEQVDSLLSKPDELARRQNRARVYWEEHVRPDQIMRRVLSIVQTVSS